jgi:hypothetical protein
LWPDIEQAYGWAHQAAHILGNPDEHSAEAVRLCYEQLLAQIAPFCHSEPVVLAQAATQFIKVTHSYQAGLFGCYTVADLPRTNNDLEQLFGWARYQERRASGRRGACPGMVVRGPVRLVAATLTRQRPVCAQELRPRCLVQSQRSYCAMANQYRFDSNREKSDCLAFYCTRTLLEMH